MKTKYIVQSIAGLLATVAFVSIWHSESSKTSTWENMEPMSRLSWSWDWVPESVVCSDDGKTVYVIISSPSKKDDPKKYLLVSHDSGKTWRYAF